MNDIELCEQYLQLIKGHQNYDKNILDRCLKKHSYDLNFDCMCDLSKLWDWMQDDSYDVQMELRMKDEYGITKEYDTKMNQAWDELTIAMEGEGLI